MIKSVIGWTMVTLPVGVLGALVVRRFGIAALLAFVVVGIMVACVCTGVALITAERKG